MKSFVNGERYAMGMLKIQKEKNGPYWTETLLFAYMYKTGLSRS